MLTTVTIKDGDVEKKYVSLEDYERLEKEREELRENWVEANGRYFASCHEADRLKKKLEKAKETIDELERKLKTVYVLPADLFDDYMEQFDPDISD